MELLGQLAAADIQSLVGSPPEDIFDVRSLLSWVFGALVAVVGLFGTTLAYMVRKQVASYEGRIAIYKDIVERKEEEIGRLDSKCDALRDRIELVHRVIPPGSQ